MQRLGMPAIVLGFGMGVLSLFAKAQQHPSMPMGPPPEPDTSRIQQEMEAQSAVQPLRIVFRKRSADWTPAKLAVLPHTAIQVFNAHTGANETFSGVPLISLLELLGFPAKPRGKDFRMYLVAQGADGQEVIYALAEVIPEIHDATVLVADTMNGKSLGSTGPFQLVATGEKQPVRWVRNLVSIRVETAH